MMTDLEKKVLFALLVQWESSLHPRHERVSALSLGRLLKILNERLSFPPVPIVPAAAELLIDVECDAAGHA
jgi:hypothetical protein